jgi:N-acetylglucosamine-6-phosphate deacetylase
MVDIKLDLNQDAEDFDAAAQVGCEKVREQKMAAARFVIEAGILLTPRQEIRQARIQIADGRIERLGSREEIALTPRYAMMEAGRFIVAPGFIDLHIHGAAGRDVMEATAEALDAISAFLARHGTTAFVPTTVSAGSKTTTECVSALAELLKRREWPGAFPLGIHLEGPFINPEKRGTHRAEDIVRPELPTFRNWLERAQGKLLILTLAPELPGAIEVLREARSRGILVGIGHSDATYAEAQAAIAAGATHGVHLFNAMRALAHRDPGIVAAVLASDSTYAELIADGVHLDPVIVRLTAQWKAVDRLLLITDATSATGMPDGDYRLGTMQVHVEGGVSRDSEGRLAGSTLTQDVALRNLLRWTGWSLAEALRAVTLNPARLLHCEERKGFLREGADADLVVLTTDCQVVQTIVGGQTVFSAL